MRRLARIPSSGVCSTIVVPPLPTSSPPPSSSPSPSQAAAATTSTALLSPIRQKSAKFFVHLDNPTLSERHVQEELARMTENKKTTTTAYLHALINAALCAYQKGDFALARERAIAAHQQVTASKGPLSSVAYFSATTAARSCAALAEQYAAEIQRRSELSMLPVPTQEQILKRTVILQLQKEGQSYQRHATRVVEAPQNGFMRSRTEEHRKTGWDRSSSSASYDTQAQTPFGEEWQKRRTQSERHVARSAARKVQPHRTPK